MVPYCNGDEREARRDLPTTIQRRVQGHRPWMDGQKMAGWLVGIICCYYCTCSSSR